MVYRALGILENQEEITVVFSEFLENAGSWSYTIIASEEEVVLQSDFGDLINLFITKSKIEFQVALVALHSDNPEFDFQGGAIAAKTKLPVITQLSSMDLALGGNGNFYTSSCSKLHLQDEKLNNINQALCVAFMGVLRWREEYNFLSSDTGANRNSIGGALWMGQDA